MAFVLSFLVLLVSVTKISALPDGWTAIGCFTDNTNARAIDAASYFDPAFSTQDNCAAFCDERNYSLAGAEFGRECYCGNQLINNSTQAPLNDCNVPCPFSTATNCGGANRLSLFSKNQGPKLVTQLPVGTGIWNYVGTFDNTKPNSQPFAVEAIIAGTQKTSGSIENCLTWCFNNFGCSLCSISDGGVCECGNNLSSGRIPAPTGAAVCPQNTSEICGDTAAWQVYQFSTNTH